MKNVPLKVCLFWAAFILAAFLAGSVAEAARTVTGYYVVTSLTYGTDSSATVDSTNIYRIDGTNAGALDSADRLTTTAMELSGYTQDALSRYTIDVPGSMDEAYNPAYVALWFMSDGQILRDNAPQVTHIITASDSLRETITASVDWATGADTIWGADSLALDSSRIGDWFRANLAAGAGTGAYADSILVYTSVDSTAIGAGIAVWATPNGGGTVLKDLTDANSWAIFSMAADTYHVHMWLAGYTQTTTPDTNEVPAANAQDTFYMTPVTAGAAATPGLTSVTFTFYDGTGDSIKNVEVQYKLETKADFAYHLGDSTKIYDPSEMFYKRSVASGVATISVVPNDSIYVRGGNSSETRWHIWAYSPDGGLPLLGTEGVVLTIPASATVLVYPKNFTGER